jgi:hypothetical protein
MINDLQTFLVAFLYALRRDVDWDRGWPGVRVHMERVSIRLMGDIVWDRVKLLANVLY